MKPVIIAVDGVDYAGKSTLVAKLKAHFTEAGYRVETINFPTGCGYGAKARKAFSEGNTSLTGEYMVKNMCEVMDALSELDSPDLIIYDRHILSTYANQGMLNAHPFAEKEGLYKHALVPQQYYYLTLPYQVAVDRARERYEKEGVAWDDAMTSIHLDSELRWVALNRTYVFGAEALDGKLRETTFHRPGCHNQKAIDSSFNSICMNISSELEKVTA